MLSALLGSRQRAQLLAALTAAPDSSWSVRGLAGAAGIDPKAAWVEVQRLVAMGVVRRSPEARARLRWDRQHPLASALERITQELAADGVFRILRRHCASWPDVSVLLFGSWARGTHARDSDVDLLVIGSADETCLHRSVLDLEIELRRSVDYRQVSREEFERQRDEPSSTVSSVLSRPHVWIRQ